MCECVHMCVGGGVCKCGNNKLDLQSIFTVPGPIQIIHGSWKNQGLRQFYSGKKKNPGQRKSGVGWGVCMHLELPASKPWLCPPLWKEIQVPSLKGLIPCILCKAPQLLGKQMPGSFKVFHILPSGIFLPPCCAAHSEKLIVFTDEPRESQPTTHLGQQGIISFKLPGNVFLGTMFLAVSKNECKSSLHLF